MLLPILAVLIGIFCFEALAVETYGLRSNINPTCGASSLKFADIFAENNTAVMGSYNCKGAFIFDITNPDAPVLANWYNPSPTQQFLEAIIVGNRGYFGSGTGGGGVHIVDLTNPYQPVLLGIVDSTRGGGHNSIHEMVVFNQNGQTFLIENLNSFSSKILKIINVTNPAAPVFVRNLNPTEPSWVHAMVVKGDRLFTSGWGNSTPGRTEIYNISNIATTAPVLLGFIADIGTAGNNMHSAWPSEDGNYLYSARETSSSSGPNAGDIRVYNITDPGTPLLIRKLRSDALGLNASTPHNPVVKGNKLYVSWYQAGLQVFDLTVQDNPIRVGEYDTYAAVRTDEEIEQQARELAKYDPSDIVCGRVMSLDLSVDGYNGAWAVYPFLGEDKVLIGDMLTGLYVVDVGGTPTPTPTPTAMPTPASIAGSVTYAISSIPVAGANLLAAGASSIETVSQGDGSYLLTNLTNGAYTVTPSKQGQDCLVINGVLANDASMVARHLVGLTTLSADQLAAANASGSGSISSLDAALIARKAVGICTASNHAGEWTFMPANRTYSNLTAPLSGENYKAVMVGDVNGDWTPGRANRQADVAAVSDALRVSMPRVHAASGSSVSIPLQLDGTEASGLTSYQFDIEYDPAVIRPAAVAADLAGTLGEGLSVISNVLSPGLLRVAVYGAFPATGDGVFAIVKFSVIGRVGTQTPLTISQFIYNDGISAITVEGGGVKVTAPTRTLSMLTGEAVWPRVF